MIKIKLKCFSQVKYALGQDEMVIEMKIGSTTSDLERVVRQRSEGKLEHIDLSIAINKKYVKDEVALNDGDEVALIPPVQGG
jgi:molybdopterin synthase catalytic subunit